MGETTKPGPALVLGLFRVELVLDFLLKILAGRYASRLYRAGLLAAEGTLDIYTRVA